jgi:ectoine hydroxylase-related dioxygenase (phytanoyl-CoA dioxygenase family)
MTVSLTTTANREQYDRDGFTIYRGVIDADLLAEASAHVEWLQEQHPDLRGEQLNTALVADDPFWLRLVGDGRLLDIAADYIGQDIDLFASHYISKPPFSGQAVRWHQDGSYWPLEPMAVVSLWLAVDHSTPENGCVRVIPGSHRDELHALRDTEGSDDVLGSETVAAVDESLAVDLVLAPGDVEVHHPNIMHASEPNTSPHRRCGLTIRYIPVGTRILGEAQPWPCRIHLRGEAGDEVYAKAPAFDPARHFAYAGAPSA